MGLKQDNLNKSLMLGSQIRPTPPANESPRKSRPEKVSEECLGPTGRSERRFPIVVVVNLAALSPMSAHKNERTYTDNISAHGARVHCVIPWQLGEYAEIVPVKGETPMRGEVVYCQKLATDDFFIGLKFHSHIPWSTLQRFNRMPVMQSS